MRKLLRRFISDERGGTAVEYAVIAMIVIVALAISGRAIGTKLSATFSNVSANL